MYCSLLHKLILGKLFQWIKRTNRVVSITQINSWEIISVDQENQSHYELDKPWIEFCRYLVVHLRDLFHRVAFLILTRKPVLQNLGKSNNDTDNVRKNTLSKFMTSTNQHLI